MKTANYSKLHMNLEFNKFIFMADKILTFRNGIFKVPSYFALDMGFSSLAWPKE